MHGRVATACFSNAWQHLLVAPMKLLPFGSSNCLHGRIEMADEEKEHLGQIAVSG